MFLQTVWEILCQLSPWMLLGTLIAGLLHVFLPAGFLRKSLRGTGGVFKAVALGVPLPLCSCGVIPTGIGLKNDDVSNGASVGFLISTPQTGVDSILVAAAFLGWPFALFKVLAAAVTGVVGGLITDQIEPEQPDEDGATNLSLLKRKGLRDFWGHAMEILRSIWLWLLLGVFVSAAISNWVPESTFSEVNSWGILPAIILVLLISTPLYVCATASVPIAAAMVAGGLSPAVAIVFLMAGPATNIATITSIFGRFGWKTTLVYLLTIITGSILFAVLFDWAIVDGGKTVNHSHEHLNPWWAQLSAVFLILLCGWFAILDTSRLWKQVFSVPSPTDELLRVEVGGMHCQNCVEKVEKALQKIEGVDRVQVNLRQGVVQIWGSIVGKKNADSKIRSQLSVAGFDDVGQSSNGQ